MQVGLERAAVGPPDGLRDIDVNENHTRDPQVPGNRPSSAAERQLRRVNRDGFRGDGWCRRRNVGPAPVSQRGETSSRQTTRRSNPMLQIPNYSGQHPELTTPNRRVGPVRLSNSILPPWLDEHLPCWAFNHHAFGPLYTDHETGMTGRDCYRCGQWFAGTIPDGRKLMLRKAPAESSSAMAKVLHFFAGHHGKRAFR